MKRILLLPVLISICISLSGQKVSKVDFDAIKKTLDTSPKLYKDLLNRFVSSDSTLTNEEFSIIYYGQCYQEDYNPYGSDVENFDKFKKHYLAKDYDKALPIALKMIRENPLDMKMTFKTLVCYHHLNDEAGKNNMIARYNGIMKTIFDSGDGKTDSTAFVVMCVSDEYELMASLQVENTSQSLIGFCDVMRLKENDLGIDKLYFNVSKPMASMMDMFKKK
ncbi:MAG TPA: DUF4919 domain-containing protein [Chitinophagaceae bacterium]|nr:DUF4919 domain-containing protein [Chitinophagaceae bacterium]